MRLSSTGGDIRGAPRETSRTKLSAFFEHFQLMRYHDERILVFTIFTITETRLIFSVISVLFAYFGNICSEIEEKKTILFFSNNEIALNHGYEDSFNQSLQNALFNLSKTGQRDQTTTTHLNNSR